MRILTIVPLLAAALALLVGCPGQKPPPTGSGTGSGTGTDTSGTGSGTGSGTDTGTGSGTDTPAPPAAGAAQGEPCPDGACADGLTCVDYYGIAGPSGPKFTSCEIPCSGAKAACPSGQRCIVIADGPGQVCRPEPSGE
jgi:hypothetical protein